MKRIARVTSQIALECASPLALCGRRRSRGGFTVAMRTDAIPAASLRSRQSAGGPAHSKFYFPASSRFTFTADTAQPPP